MTGTERQPADHAVRRRFIEELDTSFFLEAGAGSGKTSVIVDRVVNLVRHGRRLPEIVAITFTEKAAGELREKIRDELAKSGLRNALREVDAAPIQTIHAFAAGILRERALDAGLDPDFRVLDQLQADLRFAQSWRSWLWSGDAPQAAMQRVIDLGLPLNQLQLAADQMSRNRDLTGDYAAVDHGEERSEDQIERDEALAAVTDALRQFIADDAARRRREGVLTYDDLLLEARDLLVESEIARRDLRTRYRAFLIDEFQDTDPLQAQIALLLAADSDTDDWTQATPGPGRLVMAGDPKQSIYRFRRADIDIYEQVREIFAASSDTASIASLTVNFRARPQLCRWHNRVLERVLPPDPDYPRAQARWESTVAFREDAGPAVAVIPSQRQFDRAPEARDAEAELIANLIVHMREPDAKLGALDSEGRARPPEFRDIAILVRTRTAMDRYTGALDRAGIPYHFDSGQGFYQQPEIRAVAHLLQALDDPTDEAAAIAALKSPIGSASDGELYELRRALGDRPLVLAAAGLPDSYDGRLRGPISSLAELRSQLDRFRLPELVEHVVRASGLLQAQAVGVRPAVMRQRQANLRMLVQRASHFADNNQDSLRPFVRWLSRRGVRHLPESESATTEADDDAVRILTIHQAKGLEFPIVVLPKLQDQPASGADFIVDRQNNRVEFKLGDDRAPFRSPGYLSALRRDRAYGDAEARRMLYVAATRARDWLILPSFPSDSLSRRDSFHTYLDEAAPDWLTRDSDADVMVFPPRAFDAASAHPLTLQLPPVEELRDEWRGRHEQSVTGGQPEIEALTPSGLGTREHDQWKDVGVKQGEGDAVAIDPLDFGQAVHEALELADFNDLELTLRRAVGICRKHHIEPKPVTEHVARAFESGLLRRAARSNHVLRELPLASVASHEDRTTITEGVADLLFREGEGWILVDYKSDAVIPDERREVYNRQLQLYASMLQGAGVEVSEAHVLLTSSGDSIAVPLEDASAS
ncbi:MAG: UvrD-helicase domain-containing protein [Chloroflexota bacterium]|nr:UvrD-helicase domain-containing protein [Chloroflexota bacterium]MDE2895211.1 UvrD-helicase domain-containing protein [Chloroflexota bacterium]